MVVVAACERWTTQQSRKSFGAVTLTSVKLPLPSLATATSYASVKRLKRLKLTATHQSSLVGREIRGMFEVVGQFVGTSRHICPAATSRGPFGGISVKPTFKLPLAALCAAAAVSFASSESRAVVVFDDNFDSYTSGQPLLGQGGWTITGTSTVNPLMVAGGPDNHVPLTTTGQDAFKAFDSGVVHADGDDLQTSVEINVSAAQAAGDYFFHLSDPVATTTNFFQRLFARSSGTGFQLGIQGTSGTGGTVAYGSTVLNLTQTYDVDFD